MEFRVGAYLWLAFDKYENEINNPKEVLDVQCTESKFQHYPLPECTGEL